MARKPVQFEMEFHQPDKGEGENLFADKLGELHMNLVKQILNKKDIHISKKNKIYAMIQKYSMDKV